MKKSPVQAIDRAFSVLRLLSRSSGGLKAIEIAQDLDLKQTTVHGLLRSLLNWNAVEHDPRTGVYRVGFGIYELSRAFSFESKLKEVAQPALASLSRALSETVNLGILRNFRVYTLVEIVPERSLAAREVPYRGFLPLTQARGKAVLAFTDEKRRAEFLKHISKRKDTGDLDLEAFQQELEQIRRQGYAVARHRRQSDVVSYAVPVLNSADEVIAAIGLVVPEVRMPSIDEQSLVERMQQSAREITARMDGSGP